MANFQALTCESVCAYLKENIPNLSDGVVEKVKEHKIDGEVFLALDDDYLREIAPLLGDRLKMKRVIADAISANSAVSFFLLV